MGATLSVRTTAAAGVGAGAQLVGVPPAETPLGLWSSYRTARRNVLELIPAAAFHDPIVAGGPGTNMVFVQDPEAIDRVLRGAVERYPRSLTGLRMMSPRRGHNIVSATGPLWRAHRKAMSPLFQPRALAAHSAAMTAAATRTCERIEAGTGEPSDVFPALLAATRDVICDLALSGHDTLDRDALTDCIERGLQSVTRFSLFDVLRLPLWVPRPASLFDRSRARLDAMADAIAEARRQRGPCDPPDMLDLMLEAERAQDHTRLTQTDVRNDIIALLFAGHETTALALAWSLYLLAIHPGIQERVSAVAQEQLGSRAATFEDIPDLTAIRHVVEEALRLYPPAAVISRMAREDDELAGQTIAAGTTVLIAIYALHRRSALWPSPEVFDPSRFEDGNKEERAKLAYLPFGAGPRVCVGAQFAFHEAAIILSTLLARYRFALAPGFAPEPRMWFTLRPANGLRLVVHPR